MPVEIVESIGGARAEWMLQIGRHWGTRVRRNNYITDVSTRTSAWRGAVEPCLKIALRLFTPDPPGRSDPDSSSPPSPALRNAGSWTINRATSRRKRTAIQHVACPLEALPRLSQQERYRGRGGDGKGGCSICSRASSATMDSHGTGRNWRNNSLLHEQTGK